MACKLYPDFLKQPPPDFGGTLTGRAALAVAIRELKSGAGEIGGANSGHWVKKYLNGLAPEGSPWCAGFVSYCFANSGKAMRFQYTVGARELINQFKSKGWSYKREDGLNPEPGDIVVWWCVSPGSWQGHAGIVHHFQNKVLHTIEGNRTSKVAGFSYNLKSMQKLLGFARARDALT